MSVGMILSSVLLRCKRFAYGAVRPSFSNKGPPRSDAKSAKQNMKPFASTGSTKICRDMVGSVEHLTKSRESMWGLKQETHKRDIYDITICKIYEKTPNKQTKYENCLENPQALEILRGLIVTVTNALFCRKKKKVKTQVSRKKKPGKISAQALRPPIDL